MGSLSSSTSVVSSSTSAEPHLIMVSFLLVRVPKVRPTTGSSRTPGAPPGVRKDTSESRETCPRNPRVSVRSNLSHPGQLSETLSKLIKLHDKGNVCNFLK